jgi:hypothetical protein
MRNRCNNINCDHFKDYGGRGIAVCKEWENFENFKEWAFKNGYTESLTLDRIDNNMGYSPKNCRWCNRKTQQNNRRNNSCVEINGVTHTLKEWSEIYKINYSTLRGRIRNGWDVVTAITKNKRGVKL